MCTFVLVLCFISLLVSSSMKWAGLEGIVIFFTKKKLMSTLVRYKFFVLHFMMASPLLPLLLLAFKRTILRNYLDVYFVQYKL